MNRVVAAAQRAASDGRALDAVDLLAELPAAMLTPELEVQIVDLRHRAFEEIDRTPGRRSWPAVFADPCPGAVGIPEVAPEGLDSEILGGAIVHHGCLRVNGLFGPERVARMRTLIDEAYDERDRLGEGEMTPGDARRFIPFALGQAKAEWGQHAFVRVVDVPHALSELVQAFAETGVRDAVVGYLGERPVMIANKWVLRRAAPARSRCPDYHQDGAFLGEAIRVVNCWIALSDCGPGTGAPAIDVVLRRYDGVLESGVGSQFPWSLAESVVEDSAGDAPIVSPVFAPGDAFFFDERLVHRTAPGPDTEARYAVESWFVAPSSYPAKHVPVVF